MLSSLQGRRARLTVAGNANYIPIKIVNANGIEAVAIFEHRSDTAPTTQFLVESFTKSSHVIFPARPAESSPPQAIAFSVAGKSVESPTECDLALLHEKLPVEVKFKFKKRKTFVIAGGELGMAILLDEEIPPQSKIEVTITEDEHSIQTEGFITHSIPRGKGFLAIYRFSVLPRVTMMYWSRILKAG
ncbi:MAG: hypothetical protein ACKVQS_05055 [Fimbriimonadaceae bacterium]